MSLLEGDATLVMERFVKLRLGLPARRRRRRAPGWTRAGLGAPGLFDLPDAPPVIRDHLMQPYLAGLGLARAIWAQRRRERHARRLGAASRLDGAGAAPVPLSSPASRRGASRPRSRRLPGRASLSEGTLGELLIRSLLEAGGEAAAEGWGGDGWRLYDTAGRTLLLWRSEWDTPSDAHEFAGALRDALRAPDGTRARRATGSRSSAAPLAGSSPSAASRTPSSSCRATTRCASCARSRPRRGR